MKAYVERIPVIKKRQIKKFFDIPHREKMTDLEWTERAEYINGVMNLSGWHLKTLQDAEKFNETFEPDWIKLFSEFKKSMHHWARFDDNKKMILVNFDEPPFSVFVRDRFIVRFH